MNGKVSGVIKAKKQGVALSGIETQSAKYTQGLPTGLQRWQKPVSFSCQSTGIGTRFTYGRDPESDSDDLPAPDVIALEIAEDLEAALAQFREIAGDMSGAADVTS